MNTVGAALALMALWSTAGCGRAHPNAAVPYHAVFADAATAGGPAARGTMPGDYRWAASAPSWDQAAARWREFLTRHAPPGGEFQDNFQKLRIDAAHMELARVYDVLGRIEEGDREMRSVKPGLK